MSLRTRQGLAALGLGLAILMGIYVAIPGDGALVPEEASGAGALVGLVDVLNGIEAIHMLSHIVVFGGAAWLLGPWGDAPERGSARLAWAYIIPGALLMEGGQVIVGYADDIARDLLLGVLFDLAVNGLAALGGLWLARRYDGL